MDDAIDWLIGLFLVVCGVALVGVVVFGIADAVNDAEGVVVQKYYDDPDLVCSKGCWYTQECWTLVIGDQPWWNEGTCVSKSEYDSVDVGDYYKE